MVPSIMHHEGPCSAPRVMYSQNSANVREPEANASYLPVAVIDCGETSRSGDAPANLLLRFNVFAQMSDFSPPC